MKFAARRSLWHVTSGATLAPGLDLRRDVVCPLVRGGHGDPVLGRRRRVGLDDAKRVEAAGDRPGSVQAPEQAADRPRVGAADLALDEAGDEQAVGEPCDLGADAELGREDGGLVLVLAVDPEQAGVLAADPQHERLVAHRDLEVVVGDPAAQRLDLHGPPRPEPLHRLLDAHARS